jgi:hypothetical protein
VNENGIHVWRDMEEYDTSAAGAHANWPDRFFAKVVDSYLGASRNRGGRVGDAPSYLFPAGELLGFAKPLMERVAVDREAANTLGELPQALSRRGDE